MFRKPKKSIQRRVFTIALDDEDKNDAPVVKMDIDERERFPPPPPNLKSSDIKKEKKRDKTKLKSDDSKSKKSLLSFADDEDDAEVFQVKKSSHSKKVMRMLDKERRKKKSSSKADDNKSDIIDITSSNENGKSSSKNTGSSSSSISNTTSSTTNFIDKTPVESNNKINSDSIQTEIRTDDFVLVVKKSEPENVILNGRAAICAGRDDMSSEDDEDSSNHRFSKPENLKLYLERGSIPDAAMIHAARKKRQKAREQGDFIPVEEPKEPPKKGSRLAHDDNEDDGSEDERVDMNAITGIKEREERREKFYSVQNEYSEEDSDHELNEWENQQIRKGVTGVQLVSAAQQESLLSRFTIKNLNQIEYDIPQSTGTLLEQAYAQSLFEKPRQLLLKTQKNDSKPKGPRPPQEITECLKTRLNQLKEIHENHLSDIERIEMDVKVLKLDALNCSQNAPTAAAKYRFYQELRGYITDLIECLDEKVPLINDLEKRSLNLISKHANYLIERRRQDVRDQAKEMTDASKPGCSNSKRGPEYEEHTKRAAEREGRRTRRRCDREKKELLASHLDGMSSDDEMHDQELKHYQISLDEVDIEGHDLFEDTNEDYCHIENVLTKFEVWRKTDMDSYKDAFVSLCLPKVIGPMIRLSMITWNPFGTQNKDIDKMDWYPICMQYGSIDNETEDTLATDPDVKFVPIIIEKIILPKLTELIENCWDPLSTTQNLRLISVVRRLGRDYPLREQSKSLQTLFNSILDKMKNALENDIFIPIFPKQMQEAKTSFFQRQFCSGLKLFRNLLSWQGLIADNALRELAISSLLNRYLLSAMRVCTANDATAKAYVIVNTLPTAWLQPESTTLKSLNLFVTFIKIVLDQLDKKNPLQIHSYEKAKQILQRLHSY